MFKMNGLREPIAKEDDREILLAYSWSFLVCGGVLVVNHLSLFDTPLLSILPTNVEWVIILETLKRENADAAGLGTSLWEPPP